MSREQRTLLQLLSAARMAPYLSVCDGDWEQAIGLYDWNAKVSAAFFESLHYLEVGLRNAMDEAASTLIETSWLRPDSSVLTPRSRKAVVIALAQAGGSAAPHGKIVAELPFGFWWSLLADEYNRRLWQPAIRYAFEGQVRRRKLHAELDDLRRLRNRIAHHEPIHSRDLQADFARVINISNRIGASLGAHIAGTSRVPQLLSADQRP
ncbi:hypothetical protein ACF3NT_04295 [Naumannella halotolerans]|uniref:Abi-like protein n=1 Tax=Naumannella halotolerans TaxID=993414 RepID=A0A4R7J7Q0_9ACTN|nr:hypothetical protein [Naumannella halotolerans]TDT33275.1 hypothetical protein CLV29_0880 [Naumannella halotolerans]